MPIRRLPTSVPAVYRGWWFTGPWSTDERAVVERMLCERLPNASRAQADPWLFLRWQAAEGEDCYYAHCPHLHPDGFGYATTTAEDLADELWNYYFTLQLGPLRWWTVDPPRPPAAPVPARAEERDEIIEQMLGSRQHATQGLALLAAGDAAAARRELVLALALYDRGPLDIGLILALGDAEVLLGDDTAAQASYTRALAIAQQCFLAGWHEADVRLRLACCALRQDQLEEAHSQITVALRLCEAASDAERSAKSALNRLTASVLSSAAEIAFRRGQFDDALALVERAVTCTERMCQDYAARAKTLTTLAWMLYRHDETSAARRLARRALQALNQWVSLDTMHLRPLRTTLRLILGPQADRYTLAKRSPVIPGDLVSRALATVRRMDDWYAQALALIELAPYLRPGQLSVPLHDIYVLVDSELPGFYIALVRAATAHALPEPHRQNALAALPQWLRVDERELRLSGQHARYAAMLRWIGRDLDPAGATAVQSLMLEHAAAWHAALSANRHPEVQISAIEGLSVLLPVLPPTEQAMSAQAIEDALLEALHWRSCYPSMFRAALVPLAQLGAGWQLYEQLTQQAQLPMEIAISMLAFIGDDDMRRATVESILRSFEERTVIAATTELADNLIELAPYLDGEQARRALGVASSVRGIVPRVRALVALRQRLPQEQRHAINYQAYTAAQRSKSTVVRGAALVALVTGVIDNLDEGLRSL